VYNVIMNTAQKKHKKMYYKKWYSSEAGKLFKERNRANANEQHKRYRQSKKGKIVAKNKANRMKKKYPEKWKARYKLRYAVGRGTIKKLECAVCGDVKSFAHHPDYTKPLEVTWLCLKHHREVHDNKS
jgi:hypothetical protein